MWIASNFPHENQSCFLQVEWLCDISTLAIWREFAWKYFTSEFISSQEALIYKPQYNTE